MTYRKTARKLLLSIAFALTACGGGSGGGEFVGSTPPPPPPPGPPPATQPLIFPNVTQSTGFATLGYEGQGQPIDPADLIDTGFSVTYDAASNAYIMDVPAAEPGAFKVENTGDRYWNGVLLPQDGSAVRSVYLNVFRPGPQNWDFPNLTYTSFAEYSATGGRLGEMAFGVPAPASAIPISGTATYTAFAAGQTDAGFSVRGSATMQFDFGGGTLSGSFDPYIYDLLGGDIPLGHYSFENTVFGVGSTSFSGQLSRAGIDAKGSFNGLFTGPNAEELMARWTAPLPDPETNRTTTMFGVWVGKKN